MAVTSLELAKTAAIAADQKKAEDILVLDLTGLSDVCDYFVICTGGMLVWLTLLLMKFARRSRQTAAFVQFLLRVATVSIGFLLITVSCCSRIPA